MNNEYPECEKLSGVSDEKRTLLEFFEWLGEQGEENDHGWYLCEWTEGNHSNNVTVRKRTNEIIHSFLEIDDKKLEDERRTMLSKLQEQANKGKS